MLLPLTDAHTAILIKGDRSRILDMTIAAGSGLYVSLLVEVPMGMGYIAKLGLVP